MPDPGPVSGSNFQQPVVDGLLYGDWRSLYTPMVSGADMSEVLGTPYVSYRGPKVVFISNPHLPLMPMIDMPPVDMNDPNYPLFPAYPNYMLVYPAKPLPSFDFLTLDPPFPRPPYALIQVNPGDYFFDDPDINSPGANSVAISQGELWLVWLTSWLDWLFSSTSGGGS